MTKKVKFLQDFQGKETREVFYKQGQEAELPDHLAEQLLADRRVELVNYPKPTTPEEFLKPVVFENVTGVETEEVTFEELKEEVAEVQPDPKPKSKRGKK